MANNNLPGGRAYYTGKNAYASQAFELDTRRLLQDLSDQNLQLQNALDPLFSLLSLAGLSVIGNATNATGVPAAITGTDGQVLRVAGTALGFGAIATAGITDAAVTYAKIQNVAGLSVFGRASNTSGVGADITAGSDAQVLRRSGTALGFGTVDTAGITDAAVTMAKLANLAGLSVNGRSASTSGVPAAITSGGADQVLRADGTNSTVGFGTLASGALASGIVTYTKIQNLTGLSVMGRSTNSSGVGADITGTTDQVLRVDSAGTTLGFGTVATGGIANAAVTMAKLANLAGLSVIGNATNATGVPAAITGTDGQVLRVAGTALGFGAIATAGITDAAVTYAKIQNVAGLSVFGRASNTSGVGADITGTDGHALRVSGTTLGFGNILTNFITGTATNDNASSGNIGEYVESVVAAGTIGSWSNDSPKNITSISLTAGDWDIEAFGSFSGSITGTSTQFSISTTTGTTDNANIAQIPSVPTSTSEVYLACCSRRISTASTTTIFLVGRIKFSGGTPTAGGTLRARRMR